MGKFCTECGKEIAEGVAFCTECGTKAPDDSTSAETEKLTENITESMTETATETNETATATEAETPAVHTPPEQSYQAQQPDTQPAPDPASKVVGMGVYFGLILLFAVPIIGFIACIIMAFAPKNKNIKNFARATLIWLVIALVIGGLVIGGIYMLTNRLMDYVNELTNGQFGNFGELFGQLGEMKGLMDQFQNGGLEGLPIE